MASPGRPEAAPVVVVGQGVSVPAATPGRPNPNAPLGQSPRPAPSNGVNPIGPQTPPVRAPECPPVTANPVGCPPLPKPQPIVPQPGHPSLAICRPLPLEQLRFPPGSQMVVCGSGFRPGEAVTITVVGRRGTVSASAEAGPDGSFRSALPPTTCQVMPLYAVARGNKGSVSNALPMPLLVCRRG